MNNNDNLHVYDKAIKTIIIFSRVAVDMSVVVIVHLCQCQRLGKFGFNGLNCLGFGVVEKI